VNIVMRAAPIPRVRGIEPDEFARVYLARREPVIVQGLYDGTPLAELSTLERASSALAALPITLDDEFGTVLRALHGAAAPAPEPLGPGRACTLADYLAFVRAVPSTTKLASFNDVPAALAAIAPVPALCRQSARSEPAKRLFIGNAGNRAHLHFDTDGRDALLYQAFGRKRIVLVPDEASHKLLPVRNFSGYFLEHFDADETASFLAYAGAREAILHPGEAVYVPVAMWHYVEYLDTAMSIAFRFDGSPNRYREYLVERVHRTPDWQILAAHFASEEDVESSALTEFAIVAAARLRRRPSAAARRQAVAAALRTARLRLERRDGARPYAIANLGGLEEALFDVPDHYHDDCGAPADAPALAVQRAAVDRWCMRGAARRRLADDVVAACFAPRAYADLTRDDAAALAGALALLPP
jgi:hypothetical protein